MRNQATHEDLATAFNRVTDARRDVLGILNSGVTADEERTLTAVYNLLGNCRSMVEGLIDDLARQRAAAKA